MYTQIWSKYLPIIKILLKRSITAEQTLAMNVTDFERAGAGRKAGYKFNIQFNKGRVDNIISSSPLASNLAAILLEDEKVKELLNRHDFHLSMNAKFQISIKHIPKAVAQEDALMLTEQVAGAESA
jgi:hypothetical protein